MEETRHDGNPGQTQPAAPGLAPPKKSWWQRLLHPVEITEPQKLPEGTPLPDILTKMLVDSGCTVNKDGMEKLADYFISTLMQAMEDHEAYLRKAKQEVQDEYERYRIL